MHCALRLEEIYARVVQCLASDMEKDEKEPLAALAALARTCRAFSDLALDIVWQAPPLLALAQRMDDSVWYMVEEKTEHRPFSLFLVRRLLHLIESHADADDSNRSSATQTSLHYHLLALASARTPNECAFFHFHLAEEAT
jgi:hypothetical protein